MPWLASLYVVLRDFELLSGIDILSFLYAMHFLGFIHQIRFPVILILHQQRLTDRKLVAFRSVCRFSEHLLRKYLFNFLLISYSPHVVVK